MLRMILQSREYAVWIFFRRLMDSANPPKVPNPYGAGYNGARVDGRATARHLHGRTTHTECAVRP